MRYILFIYPDPNVELGAEERAAIPGAVGAWIAEMTARGVREQGHALTRAADSKTIRMRGGELMINDGPASDLPAQIAGFNILNCADLDEALEVAAQHPVAAFGTLELRAFDES